MSTKTVDGGPGGKTTVYALIKSGAGILENDPKVGRAARKMYDAELRIL